jgi:proline iminopeptidase
MAGREPDVIAPSPAFLIRYRVILFDQRGCAKSTPSASDDDATAALTDNTTQHLIDDVLQLRRELNTPGKMHVFGGSWGSTLALAYAIAQPATVQTLILRGVFLCRRTDVDYFFQGNAADFAANPLAMPMPGTYLEFPTAWQRFVREIPPEDRVDVVKGLAKAFAVAPQNDADRERLLKVASACTAWETTTSRLNRDENSQSQPNQKYALTAARILIHYMIDGGFSVPSARRTATTTTFSATLIGSGIFPCISYMVVTTGCAIYTRQKPWQGRCAARAITRFTTLSLLPARQPGARNRLQAVRDHG